VGWLKHIFIESVKEFGCDSKTDRAFAMLSRVTTELIQHILSDKMCYIKVVLGTYFCPRKMKQVANFFRPSILGKSVSIYTRYCNDVEHMFRNSRSQESPYCFSSGQFAPT
jgi:hypothetical protein